MIKAESKVISELALNLRVLRERQAIEEKALASAENEVETARSAQEIIQFVAQAVQQKAHERVAKVVSSCLASVFDEPYQFSIEFVRKRGRTEARLRFTRKGLTVDPMEASGGGMIDVAAFALRVACLIMHRPRLRQLLVLDEPLKFLSAEYHENARAMIEQIAKDLKIQFIIVTHNPVLATGQIIKLK